MMLTEFDAVAVTTSRRLVRNGSKARAARHTPLFRVASNAINKPIEAVKKGVGGTLSTAFLPSGLVGFAVRRPVRKFSNIKCSPEV